MVSEQLSTRNKGPDNASLLIRRRNHHLSLDCSDNAPAARRLSMQGDGIRLDQQRPQQRGRNIELDSPLTRLSRTRTRMSCAPGSAALTLIRSTSFESASAMVHRNTASPVAARGMNVRAMASGGLKHCASWSEWSCSPTSHQSLSTTWIETPKTFLKQPKTRPSILKTSKTVGATLSVAFAGSATELQFFQGNPAVPSTLRRLLWRFATFLGFEGFLHRLRDRLPCGIGRWLPIIFEPVEEALLPGRLPDYNLPTYTPEEEKEIAENTAFVIRRQNDHQKDLILEDDDDLTNGFFTSHIGIHGADPDSWVVWNEVQANSFVPDIVAEIRERERRELQTRVFSAWRFAVYDRAPEDYTPQRLLTEIIETEHSDDEAVHSALRSASNE